MNKLKLTLSKCGNLSCVAEHQEHYDKWLNEQQIVYGSSIEHLWHANINCLIDPTHKARLVCIEEIAPAKCEHLVEAFNKTPGEPYTWIAYRCSRPGCGKELKPTKWEEI